jgi:ricin-type beta-trefoil lectin protein
VNLRQRIGTLLGAMVLALTAGFVVATPASAAGSYYIIKLYGYDRCLDVRDVSQANGARLQTWSCIAGALNQKFYVNYKGTGNLYQLIAQHSYKCADVTDVSWNWGAPIQQYDCLGWGQVNQVWARNNPDFYNGSNAVLKWISFTGDSCLQPVNWNLGADVVQGTCEINNKNQWEMILAPVQG